MFREVSEFQKPSDVTTKNSVPPVDMGAFTNNIDIRIVILLRQVAQEDCATTSINENGCQITADEAMVDCTVIGSFYDSYGSGLGFVLRLPYQVEPLDVNSEFPVAAGNCPNSLYPGFLKFVTNQVQTSIGTPVAVDGLQVADIITTGSRRDLGSGTDTGSGVTTGDGSFQDRYSVCSSACPGSSGETDALQSWTVNGIGLPHVNGIIYKCSSIKVDGQ